MAKTAHLVSAEVTISIEKLCGGFPGSIDAMRRFLQSPPMVKRVPDDVREQFLAEEPFNADAIDAQDVVRTGFRHLPDGRPYVGAWQIKAALQQAGETMFAPKTSPSIYSMARAIKRNLEIIPQEIPLLDASPERQVEISQIIQHPRNPDIKIPSIRQRQVIDEARAQFSAVVLPLAAGVELVEQLEQLFEVAGAFIGLGTDRGYGYGRFVIDTFEWRGRAPKSALAAYDGQPDRRGIDLARVTEASPA